MIIFDWRIFIYQVFPTLIYTIFLIIRWNSLTFSIKKFSLACIYLLSIRLDKNFTLLSFIKKEQGYEMNSTILLTMIYFMNIDQNFNTGNGAFVFLTKVIYYGVYLSNLILYGLAFILLFLFIIIVTILYLKGDQITELQLNLQGLTQLEIVKLQKNNYAFFRELENGQDNLPKECSICLVDFQPEDECIQLPFCKHLFHNQCITQWFEKQIKCPNCRANIRENLQNQ